MTVHSFTVITCDGGDASLNCEARFYGPQYKTPSDTRLAAVKQGWYAHLGADENLCPVHHAQAAREHAVGEGVTV